MTTTASAHNITDALRADLARNIEQFRAAMADTFTPAWVLYADCGMVVGTTDDGKRFRLNGTSDALGAAYRFTSAAEARTTADLWNGALTREQMTARAWVNVLPVAQALERAAEEAEALLDVLAKPAA